MNKLLKNSKGKPVFQSFPFKINLQSQFLPDYPLETWSSLTVFIVINITWFWILLKDTLVQGSNISGTYYSRALKNSA